MSEPTEPLPEPTGPNEPLIPPPNEAVRGVMREQDVVRIAADLEARARELQPRVTETVENALADQIQELDREIETQQLRTGGPILCKTWREYDSRATQVQADNHLSPDGKQDRRNGLRTARDEHLEGEKERLTGLADTLVNRHPPKAPPPITQDVANKASILGALLPFTLPEDVLEQALSEVDTMTDPRRSPAERAEAEAALRHVYQPVLRRRATLPEKFAEPFIGAYKDALGLVEELLDGDHTHRAAVEIRDGFLNAFNVVNTMAGRNERWDPLIMAASEFFDWDD